MNWLVIMLYRLPIIFSMFVKLRRQFSLIISNWPNNYNWICVTLLIINFTIPLNAIDFKKNSLIQSHVHWNFDFSCIETFKIFNEYVIVRFSQSFHRLKRIFSHFSTRKIRQCAFKSKSPCFLQSLFKITSHKFPLMNFLSAEKSFIIYWSVLYEDGPGEREKWKKI